MAKPNPSLINFSEADTVKLPPLRLLEPMSNPAAENTMHRQGASHTSTPSAAVSDERTASERVPMGSPARSNFRANTATPAAAPATQGTYTSPSPPPPAPAPLSNLAGQAGAYDTHGEQRSTRAADAPHPSYGAYTTSRGAPGTAAMPPWSSAVHGALEPNTAYSLERIHAASLALYNCVGEHMERQVPPSADELYSLMPIASEISQELRSLLAVHEGRSGRDPAEGAPYYPWSSGSNPAHPYWIPGGRDDRDGKGMRPDDGDLDDKHLRRRSPSQSKSGERVASRTVRGMSSSEDLGTYASNAAGQPMRSEHVYLHQSPYAPHGPGKGVPSDGMNAGQYVPKYRKRSRAPAPGVCHACGNSDTPEWRRGPDGARTLCNACGLHFSKLVRRRTLEYANAGPGTPIPPVTIAELRASTNVGAPGGMSVSGAEDHANVARSRSSSVYSSAAASVQRPVPVDPVVDVSSATGAPPSELEVSKVRGAEEPKHALVEPASEVPGKRPATESDAAQPSKQPRPAA